MIFKAEGSKNIFGQLYKKYKNTDMWQYRDTKTWKYENAEMLIILIQCFYCESQVKSWIWKLRGGQTYGRPSWLVSRKPSFWLHIPLLRIFYLWIYWIDLWLVLFYLWLVLIYLWLILIDLDVKVFHLQGLEAAETAKAMSNMVPMMIFLSDGKVFCLQLFCTNIV